MRTHSFLSISVSVALLLSGCAVPTKYTELSNWGGTGGYYDEKISDGVYQIVSLANVSSGPSVAMEHWHRRATELCASSNYTHDAHFSEDKATYLKRFAWSGGAVTNYRWPMVVGRATCPKF